MRIISTSVDDATFDLIDRLCSSNRQNRSEILRQLIEEALATAQPDREHVDARLDDVLSQVNNALHFAKSAAVMSGFVLKLTDDGKYAEALKLLNGAQEEPTGPAGDRARTIGSDETFIQSAGAQS